MLVNHAVMLSDFKKYLPISTRIQASERRFSEKWSRTDRSMAMAKVIHNSSGVSQVKMIHEVKKMKDFKL